MEYLHHGDALVPRQQRFGGYTRALMKGLGIPVENRWGLRPAVVAGTNRIAPLTIAARPRQARLARRRPQLQLPHAPAALRGDDGRHALHPRPGPTADRSVAGRIRSRTRATRSSTRSSGCRRATDGPATCWSSTPRCSARCSAATRASSASGRTSPRPIDDARARRHPERRPAPAAVAVRGDLHPAPHRRPTRGARADAAPRGCRGLGRAHRRARRRPTPGSASRSRTRASRRWASRRTRSTASPGSSSRGWRRARRRSGDVGESQPRALGTARSGRATSTSCVTALSPDQQAARSRARARPRTAFSDLPGVQPIWRQDCHALATEREPFGFRDGIGHPAIEGSGIPGSNSKEPPFKAGEFVLGYLDETGGMPPMPRPDVLGRNGTYVVFRKLHQRVAAFRRYLKENAGSRDEEELLAAKMMGRWRSGAPLALCPTHDDPELGADPRRATTTSCTRDDATGYKTPPGSHIRRANPRDASVAGVVRLHRMIRRGTAYGPELPEGVARGRRRRSRADVRVRRRAPRAAVRVRAVRVDERRRLPRPRRREGSDRGCPRRRRRVLDSRGRPIPQALARSAAVRRHARRRVLLHARLRALRWLAELET